MQQLTYDSLTVNAPVLVIAEAGVNHCGDVRLAVRLAEAAAEAGADAVKFQTFRPEALVSPRAEKMKYQERAGGGDEGQLAMLSRLCLGADAHRKLMKVCDDLGIAFLSTPFDEDSADLLEELGVSVFKIGSGELTNLSFLRYVAAKRKPLIVSTGMAYLHEVEDAFEAMYVTGSRRIALLHCVTNYPARDADVNLRAMRAMGYHFGVPVGYSDHTTGIEVPLAAVALGATIIEKHLTLDRSMAGPDHAASLEPEGFRRMVDGIRRIETALGSGEKRPAESESEGRNLIRRSIFATCEIAEGCVITRNMLCAKRPGTYLSPKHLTDLIGRRATCRIAVDEPITWEKVTAEAGDTDRGLGLRGANRMAS